MTLSCKIIYTAWRLARRQHPAATLIVEPNMFHDTSGWDSTLYIAPWFSRGARIGSTTSFGVRSGKRESNIESIRHHLRNLAHWWLGLRNAGREAGSPISVAEPISRDSRYVWCQPSWSVWFLRGENAMTLHARVWAWRDRTSKKFEARRSAYRPAPYPVKFCHHSHLDYQAFGNLVHFRFLRS